MPSNTKLHNISMCRYLTDINEEWEQVHYKARNIVRALKGDAFNGYSYLRIGSDTKRLSEDSPQVAYDWFVDQIASQVEITGKNILCPIPGSSYTPSSTDIPRTVVLSNMLSARLPKLKVWPNLRFKQIMPRKIRVENILFQNLVCTAPVPTDDIILVDDVCTTGAHARASMRRLRASGASGDISAISVARTMLTPDEEVFGFRCDELI